MEPISLTLLFPDEIHSIAGKFIKILANSKDPFIMLVINRINELNDELTRALGRPAGNIFTDALQQKDTNRKKAFKGFINFVEAHVASTNKNEAEAAAELLDIIKVQQINMSRHTYQRHSSQLNVLFKKLQEPPDYFTILSDAKEWFNNLQKAQAEFEEIDSKKNAQEAEKKMTINDAKSELAYFLNSIICHIDTLVKLSSGNLESIADELDKNVLEITSNARSRKTRKEGKNEKKSEG